MHTKHFYMVLLLLLLGTSWVRNGIIFIIIMISIIIQYIYVNENYGTQTSNGHILQFIKCHVFQFHFECA